MPPNEPNWLFLTNWFGTGGHATGSSTGTQPSAPPHLRKACGVSSEFLARLARESHALFRQGHTPAKSNEPNLLFITKWFGTAGGSFSSTQTGIWRIRAIAQALAEADRGGDA